MGKVVRMAESATRSLFSFAQQVGTMFNGNRNLYSVYGYATNVTYLQCLTKYQRQDIAGRLVDAPADALWTKPPTFKDSLQIQSLVDELNGRLSLWQIFNRADKLAGLGSYSTVLLGFSDGAPLSDPVRPGKHKIIYMQPYGYHRMTVTSFEESPTSPRYGKPLIYTLRAQKANEQTGIMGQIAHSLGIGDGKVHYSRVLHIAENILEDDVYGIPRMAKAYNLLDDLLKIAGGSAEMFWLNARGGLHVNVDPEMQLDPEDEDSLEDQVTDYADNLQRVLQTRGVKVTPINMKVADPSSSFNVTINLLSATSGIPQRILLGAEAGQLASEQDRANWATHITQRRSSFAEPNVLKPFFQKLESIGLLPLGESLKSKAEWPEAFLLNPLERSQTSAQQARSAANLAKAMDTNSALISVEDARKIIDLAAPANNG